MGSGLASPISARQLGTPRGKTLQFSRETTGHPMPGKSPQVCPSNWPAPRAPHSNSRWTVQSLAEADRREAAAGRRSAARPISGDWSYARHPRARLQGGCPTAWPRKPRVNAKTVAHSGGLTPATRSVASPTWHRRPSRIAAPRPKASWVPRPEPSPRDQLGQDAQIWPDRTGS